MTELARRERPGRGLRMGTQPPGQVCLAQPTGDGGVFDTWAETMRQARCMAAHLRSLDLPPNSHIADLENCAHFIICDLAIWLAGHATVALYPTLNADTVAYILGTPRRACCSSGKLDDWAHIRAGVPTDLPASPCRWPPPPTTRAGTTSSRATAACRQPVTATAATGADVLHSGRRPGPGA